MTTLSLSLSQWAPDVTVEPAALRAIADELEAAQWRAETEAIEQLTVLVNGSAQAIDQVAGVPSGEPTAGSQPTAAPATAEEQVLEAPPVATPEAGLDTPTEASGTDDRPPLTCRKCGREFPTGTGIRTHERWCKGPGQGGVAGRRQVRSEGTFACADCDSSFPSAQARGAHRRYKHGIRGKASDGESPPLRAHSYLCPTCDRPFTNQTDLATHRLSHPAPPKVQPVGDRPPVGFARGVSE